MRSRWMDRSHSSGGVTSTGHFPTFFTISGIVLAALIYGFFVIKKDDQEVGGDPFYTDKQLKAQAAAKANA